MEPSQILIQNLHKSYQGGEGENLHILKGVELSIAEGESVSIVGASGTGKSTLLQILGGLDTPDEGSLQVFGNAFHSMKSNEKADFRNRMMGFVFQFHHLLQDFTALENVMMPLRIAKCSVSKATRQAKELLGEVGLEHRLHHRPSQLSGGEQQRVAVARAIANSPKILLADEPTGNLDLATGNQIMDLMLKLNQTYGITLIVITHNPDIASRTQSEYKMENGQLFVLRTLEVNT